MHFIYIQRACQLLIMVPYTLLLGIRPITVRFDSRVRNAPNCALRENMIQERGAIFKNGTSAVWV